MRNIKTAGDALMFAGKYSYTLLGEYQDPFSDDGRLTLLGESIVDLFVVGSLSWERATTTILLCGE